MVRRVVASITISLLFIVMPIVCVDSKAGFLDKALETYKKGVNSPLTKSVGANSITDSELIAGFKQALELGTRKAVELASRPGGFLDNPEIRIPLPGKLQTAADMLRRFGLGSQADAFEKSMNQAAEKAAIEAFPVFSDAVKEMTFDDARKLWKGGDTSITEYFKKKTFETLYAKFKPVVHGSVEQVGVTQRYNSLVSNPAVKSVVGNTNLDLDHYVTNKTLEGLFKLLAQQEKEIRSNPAARTTDLLKKVFGR